MDALYPLKFHPILQEKIWGGNKLKTLLQKQTDKTNIGESWELSAVEGFTSIIANGPLQGQSLKSIIQSYKGDLLGTKVYAAFGDTFPLLIKFIDAREDLSIQLHPNDTLAKERHNSFGKTEMWYVMQADDDSNLIVGFNQEVTPQQYLQHLEAKTLPKILNFDKVQEGDTYFIEVGRVHAIGAGVVIAEIQQTSDITYRVYDWDRKDADGNARELHNDLAIDAIDFTMEDDFKVDYPKIKNQSNPMVSCPYFTTNYLEVDSQIQKEHNEDSFVIYMCVNGEASITTATTTETLVMGETLLLPASIKQYTIYADRAKLLEIYV